MSILFKASLGYLLRHPWQLALAILGIAIGVAVMVAVDLANQSSRKAFLLSMDSLNGRATHQIIGGPAGLDETVYSELRVAHGIRDIAPVVDGSMRLGSESLQLIGVDVFAERRFRDFSAPGSIGRDLLGADRESNSTDPEAVVRALLTKPGAVLLSSSLAEDRGIARGDTLEIVVNGRSHTVSVVGAFGADDDRLRNLVVVDISQAQAWLGMEGRLSRIDVRIGPGDSSMEDDLRSRLPAGAQLLSAAGRTETTASMSDAFMTNLSAMSFLALLVGVFLIYNSVAFAVLQRRDLFGVLRALGITRGEVFRLVLVEAGVVGLVGALIGLALGVWLGHQLLNLVAMTLSDHYFSVRVTSVAVDGFSIGKGLIAGLGATVAAATVPATEAASCSPRLAMTRSSVETRMRHAVPLLAMAGGTFVLLAAAMLWFSGRSLVAGLVGLFILILGFAISIPACTRGLAGALAPLAGAIWGTPGRMAIAGVSMSLSRTGVAIVALAIAVSATIGVTLMVESFRGSVSEWIDNTLQSDLYVGVPRGSLDEDLIEDIAAVEGVRSFSTSRRAWLEWRGQRIRIVAIRMAPGSYAGTHIRGNAPEAAWRAFDEGAILVSDAFAYANQAAAGDRIVLPTRQGETRFAIAGIYQNYDANNGAVLMSRPTYERYFDDPGIDSIGLYLDPAVDHDRVMARISAIAEGRQALMMSSNARIRDISMQIFDRTFVITNVLYWLAVAVAVIGILGAMLALQLERAREFGILRGVGMTPGETGTLVTLQSAFMGLVAGVAAMPLGIAMAWVLIAVINRRAFGWQIDMVIDAGPLLSALFLAVVAAVIAGLYPAWKAASTSPASAMRDE